MNLGSVFNNNTTFFTKTKVKNFYPSQLKKIKGSNIQENITVGLVTLVLCVVRLLNSIFLPVFMQELK